MSAPDLCHPLVLEKPQLVEDGAGGFIQGWTVLGTLWAQITPGTGRETAASATPVSRTAYKIVVRGAPWGTPERPAPEQRFRDGTRVFNISAVTERDPQGRYLICFAEEELVV
jgi:head-tail adaptor